MAKFSVKMCLKVSGKPDAHASLSFPDATSLDAAVQQFLQDGKDFSSYLTSLYAGAAAAPLAGKSGKVSLAYTIIADGKPILVNDPGLCWHDLPDEAVKFVEDKIDAFLKASCCASFQAPQP